MSEDQILSNRFILWLSVVIIPIAGIALSTYEIFFREEVQAPREVTDKQIEAKAEFLYVEARELEVRGEFAAAHPKYTVIAELYPQTKAGKLAQKHLKEISGKLQAPEQPKPEQNIVPLPTTLPQNCPYCNNSRVCSQCRGAGEIPCRRCKDSPRPGFIPCSKCSATGKVRCSRCRGAGVINDWSSDKRKTVACPKCDGEGKLRCTRCKGKQFHRCIKCRNGKVTCFSCSGSGKCPHCS